MLIDFRPLELQELADFYQKFPADKTFLQGVDFVNWRRGLGQGIYLYGYFVEQKLVATMVWQVMRTAMRTFWHCPHGPLVLPEWSVKADFWQELLHRYERLAKTEGVDFIRCASLLPVDIDPRIKKIWRALGWRDAPVHMVNPELSLVLDITPKIEGIQKQMRKSTRYEIRQIPKHQIVVKEGNSSEDVDIFWSLHEQTVSRQGFVPLPLSHTKKQIEILADNCQIFSAKIDQKYYSSAIIVFDNETAYYHQGASVRCQYPASHAVIYQAILQARARGCLWFNFWGVCDSNDRNHPWWGLSQFKRGFGGQERGYWHCQDRPLSWRYWLGYAIEKCRRWRRGY